MASTSDSITLSMGNTMNTFEIFDFDGTLFRSPSKPEEWKGGWWGNPVSLNPPHVPEQPFGEFNALGHQFWNMDLLDRLRALERSGSRPVVVTGRLRKRFTERLSELFVDARMESLVEDGRMHLSYGGATINFKLNTFSKLIESRLEALPAGEELVVRIWEDRVEHIPHFQSLLLEYTESGRISSLSCVREVNLDSTTTT